MIRALKEAATTTALITSKVKNNSFDIRVALFHSSPALLRKRRTNWDFARSGNRSAGAKKRDYWSRRYKRLEKEELLRNVGVFTENLFQSMPKLICRGFHYDHNEYEPSSSRGSPSWSGRDYGGTTYNGRSKAGGKRRVEFCDDDFDVESMFRSAFGGRKGTFYWSFADEEPQRSSSSGYHANYRTNSWKWRHQTEDEYDDSSDDSDNTTADLTSDRLALGLSGSGPLRLEDVKNAYRACALKWHPDRHDGSSKAAAEEKFKTCSAAYQSLCDKLALS